MIDKLDLNTKASIIRKKLGEDDSSPIDIFSLAQSIDSLTLVFYPLGQNISGACFRSHLSAIIAINSSMSVGRQRYSLAHELYHLYFDQEMASTVCSSKIGSSNVNEQRADRFASYLLMPHAAFIEAVQKCKKASGNKLSLNDMIRMEQYFGVSHQAMLVRLQEENELSSAEAEAMKAGVISLAARLGFDVSLYKPSPEDKRIRVLGHYIHQTDRLLQAGLISIGKYEELLLDAFREDIVFGEGTEEGNPID
ncbi:MAG: ImmA/IrrE family metallo-endopeptidase [Lachnospiraceae bacterium]|nr:ImmA/IrrE family metallo-endopeptidase [Lachnospiraceae bacterium]